ncbi:hypothetical protein S83_066168 [Arachis hypogaea]
MHTKSLATLKHQILRNQLVATARSCITKKSSLGQLYESMQEAYQQIQSPLVHQEPSRGLKELKESMIQLTSSMESMNAAIDESVFDVEKEINDMLPIEVKEQRVNNLLQSLMVGGCIAAMPVLKMIPTSVLGGYFAFMAIENLPGNQFWEHILLIFTAPSKRSKYWPKHHFNSPENSFEFHSLTCFFALFSSVFFFLFFSIKTQLTLKQHCSQELQHLRSSRLCT